METTLQLIPLAIEAKASITKNNLPEFREMVRNAIAGINRDLQTDDDFATAKDDIKKLKQAEDAVRDAAVKIFDEKIQAIHRELNETADEFRIPRLELAKLVEKRECEIKQEIIADGLNEIQCSARLRPKFAPTLTDAIKGKRTLESMRSAVGVSVRLANEAISGSKTLLESFTKAHGEDLIVSDREELEIKSPDHLELELRRRFDAHKALIERRRLEEEAAKAKAELEAAKKQAEPELKAQPAPLPTPPKIGSIPVGRAPQPTEEQTEAHEWLAVKETVMTAFAAIKERKGMLKHPANIERLTAFGQAVNQAWKECQP